MLVAATLLALVTLCSNGLVLAVPSSLACDTRPQDVVAAKSNPEGRFALHISGSRHLYIPGEKYTVSLEGVKSPTGAGVFASPRFVGFSVLAELGQVQVFSDGLTMESEACANMVTHTSLTPKSEIQFLWTAPPPGSGCLTIRATVVENPETWYQDDGPLTVLMCEEQQTSNNDQPPVNHQCCVCEEAKYEMTFEGLWSRHTHPKDFPSNSSYPPRFSDVIGASHTTDYRFWDYSGIASEGLKQVAEWGSTRMLESELKSQSQHIRTIIKARGVSYPNVTSKTFAVFRVDKKHHLISIVSMIDPSPDWIVGVSRLELCMTNCSWVETLVLNLYPWDAGTDSGITYTSPDMPTEPRDHIRHITSTFPNDPRSPFYDPTGEEMKPLARLYLTRQRLYEKSCTERDSTTNEACEVGDWQPWSPCSVTCGQGKKTKQRFYKNTQMAELYHCNRVLTERAPCHAHACRNSKEVINPDMDSMEVNQTDDPCGYTPWSNWSECSVSCGQGVRHRFRNRQNRRNWKVCISPVLQPATQQTDTCTGPEGPICHHDQEMSRSDCKMTTWSEWSPCSVTCGDGIRKRVREPIEPYEEACNEVQKVEELTCQAELATCQLTPDQAKEVCQQPKQVGPCRGHFEKWFFDALTQSCHKFAYSGCGGNRNQFDEQEECEQICHELRDSTQDPYGGIGIDSLVRPRNQPESVFVTKSGAEGPVLDCRVTQWTPWSSCSVTCGRGTKTRSRHIIAHSKNGGRSCPKRLLRRRKCNMGPCGRDDCRYSEWSQWSHCSATCGPNSVRQRTRAIDHQRSPDPSSCYERIETKVCIVPPCRRP